MTNYIFKKLEEFEDFIDNCNEHNIDIPTTLYVSSNINRDLHFLNNTSDIDIVVKKDSNGKLVQIGDIYIIEIEEKYPFKIGKEKNE